MAETKGVQKDLSVAFDGPAPLANKFFLTVGTETVRLSFIEEAPDALNTRFRSAVTLSSSDFQELAELIKKVGADMAAR